MLNQEILMNLLHLEWTDNLQILDWLIENSSFGFWHLWNMDCGIINTTSDNYVTATFFS